MRLVNNDGVVFLEQRVGLAFSQQNTIGDQLDRGVDIGGVLKPDFEAHPLANFGIQFLGDALGRCSGRKATWLRVNNTLPIQAPPQLQAHFRQLRGFA